MEEHGGNIYNKQTELDFSVSVNPFGMPEQVRLAAEEGLALAGQYPDRKMQGLREELARFYGVSAEQVICGNGASELIYALAGAFRPARALIVEPAFSEYRLALEAHGCQTEQITVLEGRQFRPGDQVLGAVETGQYEMVFLCNPDNPTGQLADTGFLEQLVKVCRKTHCCLAADECFMEFVPEKEQNSLIPKLPDGEGILVLKAFTKMYAMPGLRLGYLLAGSREDAARIRRMLPPWNVSMMAQLAGRAALKEQAYVAGSRERLIKEREWMSEKLGRAGYPVWESRTNFLLFEGPEDLQRRCLERGIYLRDCRNFAGLGPGFFRAGMRKHRDNERLARLLEEMAEKKEIRFRENGKKTAR